MIDISRKNFWITYFIFLLLFTIAETGSAQPDTSFVKSPRLDGPDTREWQLKIRGLERKEGKTGRSARRILNAGLFVPRKIIHGLLNSVGYGATLIKTPKIIEEFDDLYRTFEKKDRKFKGYPLVQITSYYRPLAQLNLVYRHNRSLSLGWSGKYAGSDKWSLKSRLLYRSAGRRLPWSISIDGRFYRDDDRQFYGFGAEPESDQRNVFQAKANADFGVYRQRIDQIELACGLKPFWGTSFFLSCQYRERTVESESKYDNPLSQVFVLEKLPGALTKGQQIYLELAAQKDTRKYSGRISPGVRCEPYVGLVRNLGDDKNEHLRVGADLAFFLATFKPNRVLVPRIVFDKVENLENNYPLSFTDYPRQHSFRGISSRKLFRNDNYSFVFSLDYKWPLTFHLSGNIFTEYLVVTDEIRKISACGAPWSVGFGLELHTLDNELGALAAVYGSEGFKIYLNIGQSIPTNDRTNWR